MTLLLLFASTTATAQLVWTEVGKQPTQDAWISETSPTTNFSGNPLFVFNTDLGGGDILLQFEFEDIPQDSVFNGGQLFLHKVSESGAADPALQIFRNDTSWNEGTVTWNNAPAPLGAITNYTSAAAPGNDDIIPLGANALGIFVNQGWANHGLRIRHDSSIFEVSYRDSEQPLGPELYFNTIPPPDWIEVPSGSGAVTIDGDCGDYTDGLEVPWISYGGFQGTFFVKRSGSMLFVCTESISVGFDPILISLQVDPDPSEHIVPLTEDWRIVLDPETSTAHTEQGTGAIGTFWSTATLTGWDAAGSLVGAEFPVASGEFKFPLGGIGSTGPFSFSMTIRETTGSDRWGWPTRGTENQPIGWAEDRAAIFMDGFESGNVFAWGGPP